MTYNKIVILDIYFLLKIKITVCSLHKYFDKFNLTMDNSEGLKLSITLLNIGPLYFHGLKNEVTKAAIQLSTIDPQDGTAIGNSSVRIKILKGSVRLNGSQERELELQTDDVGNLVLDIFFEENEYSLISVQNPANLIEEFLFEGLPAGLTSDITIQLHDATQNAGETVQGSFCALDFLGQPVSQTNFSVYLISDHLSSMRKIDWIERSNGIYDFNFKTNEAGIHTVQIKDNTSFAVRTRDICLHPDKPSTFKITGTLDPRSSKPYNKLDLQLRLVDKYGNSLSPTSIIVKDDQGKSMTPFRLLDNECHFEIYSNGHSRRQVTISDSESDLNDLLNIQFATTWLKDPGFVIIKNNFFTPLYLAIPEDKRIKQATIKILYDARQATFREFFPSNNNSKTTFSTKHLDNGIELEIKNRDGLLTEEFIEEHLIGNLEWRCLAQGESCFTVTSKMSPESDPWQLCVPQKEMFDMHICLNLIYYEHNTSHMARAKKLVKRFENILKKNVKKCCPLLTIDIKDDCIIEEDVWDTLRERVPRMNDLDDLDNLYSLVPCKKDKCINLVIYPFKINSEYAGIMKRVGPRRGFGAVSTEKFGLKPNTIAHEIGHAFGLDHDPNEDRKNLMTSTKRRRNKNYGEELTKEQCQAIFENYKKFAGT